jgi:hypothetical protein
LLKDRVEIPSSSGLSETFIWPILRVAAELAVPAVPQRDDPVAEGGAC